MEDKESDLDVPEIVVNLKVPRIDVGEREDEEPESGVDVRSDSSGHSHTVD